MMQIIIYSFVKSDRCNRLLQEDERCPCSLRNQPQHILSYPAAHYLFELRAIDQFLESLKG